MASGTLSETRSDSLQCSVCLDQFKNPKFLHCYHTFCEGCLRRLERKSQVKCPECRSVTEIPDGGVSRLQTNFYITRRLDSASGSAGNGAEMCQFHSTEKLRYFCANCFTPICLDCKMTSPHDRHSAMDLDTAIREARDELKKQKANCEKWLKEATRKLSSYVRTLEEYRRIAEQKQRKAEDELRERAETLKRQVDAALADGLRSIRAASVEVKQPLLQHRSEAERLLQEVQVVEKDFNHVLSDSNRSSGREVFSAWQTMSSGKGSEAQLRRLIQYVSSNPAAHCRNLAVGVQHEECVGPGTIARFVGKARVEGRELADELGQLHFF
ncbi:hypothetical protein BaRGS_00022259 [Batillaria attramentaria]|uniref:Uncharacterized protein n=1 Tax=Batillaria attramentaria TaxID=370345 RepID=A0ABD0KGT8_9CAEN